ncbi:MAG: SUMF1/EgtB/PvdO family nonheme iron enzyme [Leptolyngbya sp. UWPOB_LEPTO1]|uniref:caspase, EACC1-associated type n=1 Tax=Leptolyngbya sp. UWPOB_LEPTO1 TaxID=2815653 RepID=UPI001AD0CCC8|nr:SUMF1/EgtB/PvdO family nonheme iron enzyme [Leptolyngbya sp. UWPOB_LEPTO1]MBN8562430.1 SUMF1/EgtB/PvdO family nonheme iron enzyme [Leptolyngbya sp. UWPOB_LEPTO1]
MAKIALLIGVSEYAEGLKSLPAAVKDVAAMRSILSDPEIGGFDRVVPLENPDLQTMQEEIATLFSECGEEDLLLLYFSGHGITDEFGKFYFSNRSSRKLADGRLNKGTAVPASFVHDQMENCESRRMVVILDCCNSGAFGANVARDEGTINFSRQLGGEGRIVLTSSSAIEYSFERSGEELAIYTRYLVEGLRTGAADLDEDGLISANELHEFVRTKLKRAMPSMHPERYVVRDGEKIVLARAFVDVAQKYRKLVEQYCAEGEIRPAGRRMLDRRAQGFGLDAAVARQIEDEVLQPYREHRANLAEYEEVLRECRFPLDKRDRRELQELQQELGLTDESVLEIERRIVPDAKDVEVPVSVEPKPTIKEPSKPSLPVFSFEVITVNDRGKEIDRRQSQASYRREELAQGVFLDMVWIPGGTFWMGAAEGELEARDSEKPQHQVTIKPFFMGKYAVTQAQWKEIAHLPKINRDLKPEPSSFRGQERPVERVSWEDAIEFCDRLSRKTGQQYRLPSEAEWEYACRARTTTPFHFGETITPALANYNGNYTYANVPEGIYRAQTTNVGSFPPNAFGLFDMHGNVWEWCADPWRDSYTDAPTDRLVWEMERDRENNRRVLRGGSWYYSPRACRSASRDDDPPVYCSFTNGFRIVCSAPMAL